MAKLSGEGAGVAPTAAPSNKGGVASAALPADFPSLVRLLEKSGKHNLAVQLHDQVGLVRFAPPELVLKPMRPLGGEGRISRQELVTAIAPERHTTIPPDSKNRRGANPANLPVHGVKINRD